MEGVEQLWENVVPTVRQGVTGIGVWTALKMAVPIAVEDGFFVLGVPSGSAELGGHLRMPSTSRLIETTLASVHGSPVKLRVIDGTTPNDWEVQKRKDAERRRMQEAEMVKMRKELESKTSWESIYETISRRYSETPNRTLPQNRARFMEEAIEIVAEARRSQTDIDEMGERNFARCIERVSQYTEVPSAIIALEVLKRAQEM